MLHIALAYSWCSFHQVVVLCIVYIHQVALFAWLISHQPAVLSLAISQQSFSLRTNQHPPQATSQTNTHVQILFWQHHNDILRVVLPIYCSHALSHRERGTIQRSAFPGSTSRFAGRERRGSTAGTPPELVPRRSRSSTSPPMELDLDARGTGPQRRGKSTNCIGNGRPSAAWGFGKESHGIWKGEANGKSSTLIAIYFGESVDDPH
jgi:hypothetical protein